MYLDEFVLNMYDYQIREEKTTSIRTFIIAIKTSEYCYSHFAVSGSSLDGDTYYTILEAHVEVILAIIYNVRIPK